MTMNSASEIFVGRSNEIAQLNDWYSSKCPLIAIFGPPGIGKSRLIREWAKRVGPDSSLIYDLSSGYLSSATNPEEVSANLLQLLASDHSTPDLGDIFDLADLLASHLRQSHYIIVLDQFEYALNPKSGKDIGSVPESIDRFIGRFMNLQIGNGKLVITSTLRPMKIVEELTQRNDQVRVIRSESSPDKWQLGGFSLEETREFAEAHTQEASGIVDESILMRVWRKLGGHPMGLQLFFSLAAPDQERFASTDLGIIGKELDALMTFAVKPLFESDLKLLLMICLLNRPEDLDFVETIRNSPIDPPADAMWTGETEIKLDGLRRRSLVQFGQFPKSGYSTHGIVTTYLSMRHKTVLPDLHLRLAQAYETSIASHGQDAKIVDPPTTWEVAFHYARAGSQYSKKANKWRNEWTRLALDQGSVAYYASDYDTAISIARDAIENMSRLPQTIESSSFQSKLHVACAVNQDRKAFNWKFELRDLRKALELDPTNAYAISFSIKVIKNGFKSRIAWNEIDRQFSYFTDAARECLKSEKLAKRRYATAESALISLLTLWGGNTPDSLTPKRIADQLLPTYEKLTGLSDNDIEAFTEERFALYGEMLNYLCHHPFTNGDARTIAQLAYRIASIAKSRYVGTPSIWLGLVAAQETLAQFETQPSLRIDQLKQTLRTLEEMRLHVTPTRDYVRKWAGLVIALGKTIPDEEALSEIINAIAGIREMKAERESGGMQDEIDSALLRLLREAADLDELHADFHRQQARNILVPILNDEKRWLPIEMAEQAIALLSADMVEEDINPEEATEDIEIKKSLLNQLEKKIEYEAQALPNSNFQVLRLALISQYLRHWTPQSSEPKAVQIALELVAEILEKGPINFESLALVIRVCGLVCNRTTYEEVYGRAYNFGMNAIEKISQKAVWSTGGLFKNAVFLRQLLQYRAARGKLREYLDSESRQPKRLHASRLLVDCVGHSIFPESVRDPNFDPNLREDAKLASGLYREYLASLSLTHEDRERSSNAIRELLWLRCSIFIGAAEIRDLSWVKNACDKLEIGPSEAGGARISNAQILGEMYESEDPIQQILITHAADAGMWREVGTLVSSVYANDSFQLSYAQYFYRIAQFVETHPNLFQSGSESFSRRVWKKRSEHRISSPIATLNLVRVLLQHPKGSEQSHTGKRMLDELLDQHNLTWLQRKFALELIENISDTNNSLDPTPDQHIEELSEIPKYEPKEQYWYPQRFPEVKNINDISQIKSSIRVLIVTAADAEHRAVMWRMKPLPPHRKIRVWTEKETYYIGRFGENATVAFKCRQGDIEVGSSSDAIGNALRLWEPNAIIMPGIAFGNDSTDQSMADVLVATAIIPYELQRVGDETIQRNSIPPSNHILLDRLNNVPHWSFLRPDGTKIKLHQGQILSGNKLVDNLEFKTQLFKSFPQAIGGEMEGAGLAKAANGNNTPWILVKAICDWGDGTKKDKHQELAAAVSTDLVHHMLSQPFNLEALSRV